MSKIMSRSESYDYEGSGNGGPLDESECTCGADDSPNIGFGDCGCDYHDSIKQRILPVQKAKRCKKMTKDLRIRNPAPNAISKTLGVQVSMELWDKIPRKENGRLDQEWLRRAIVNAMEDENDKARVQDQVGI